MKKQLPARNEFDQPIKGVSLWMDAWRRLRKNRMAMIGLVVVAFYILVCIFAPILPIYSFETQILDHVHLTPSLTKTAGELLLERTEKQLRVQAEKAGRSALNAEELKQLEDLRRRVETETMEERGRQIKVHQRRYVFGTDYLGRDMLARIIYGGQISIAIGVIGSLTAIIIGIIVGSIAGFAGGKVDYLLMRVVDVIYGLPYMMMVIIFMAVFGRHFVNLFFALAVVSWLTEARVVRGQIISLKNSEFVEAARSMGVGTGRIIFRHLLPNALGVIVVFATIRVPSFILLEAFLSFLGLGVSAPLASWGSLIGDAVEGMSLYPWRLFFPALVMSIFLFFMNFVGDGLRDALDPQSKNRL